MKASVLKILGLLTLVVVGGEGFARYGLGVHPAPLTTEDTLATPLATFVEFDPVLGMRYRPNVDALINAPSGDFSILFKTNEIGLRDRPMGTHLRQELKFLFLGDEFVEGWGADIDETAIVNAQHFVNEKTVLKPPVRFVIGGKSGYGAAQNLLIARQLVEAMPIRGIVFVYSALMPHADRRFLAHAVLAEGIAQGVSPASGATLDLPHTDDRPNIAESPFRTLAPKSALARWLAERWAAHAMQREHPPGDVARDRLAGMRGDASQLATTHAPTLRHVKAIADFAHAHDLPFMLIHVPLAPQVAGDEWPVGRALFGLPAAFADAPDVAIVEAFCQREQLHCLRAHEILQKAAATPDGLPLYHANEIGLTVEGNRVLGSWLGDTMYAWLGELELR